MEKIIRLIFNHTSKFVLLRLIIFVMILNSCHNAKESKKKIPGHFQKLGSHRSAEGVPMIGKFSLPRVFYGHFVKESRPIWMRGVLDAVDHPGLKEWTDDYLREHYGKEQVKVETGKTENRQREPRWLTLRQFLSLYQTENLYLVHTLKDKMEKLVLVPETLQCGGFQHAIQEAVMWMGSGNTSSVLHYDDLDNILCLLDGHKDLILIDKAFKDDVEAVGFDQEGGYSTVNVKKVDMKKFSRFQNLHWQQVMMSKGDCVFIPQKWYHQVTSSGPRHLAINLWLAHLYWFDSNDCPLTENRYPPLEPISTFGFASPNESYRSKFLSAIHDKGIMMRIIFADHVPGPASEERKLKFFDAIDKNADSLLSWKELYTFDIDKAILKFPDIFDLPGSPLDEEDVKLYDDNDESDDKLPEKDESSFANKDSNKGGSVPIEEVLPDSFDALKDGDNTPLPDDPVGGISSSTENDDNDVGSEELGTDFDVVEDNMDDGNEMVNSFTGQQTETSSKKKSDDGDVYKKKDEL